MTKPLEHYLRPRPTWTPFFWSVPLALLALAAVLANAGYTLGNKVQQVHESNLLISQARARNARAKPNPAELELQKRWGEIKAERDFPWSQVFNSVERADRNNIELLEVQPDKRNRRVTLRGEALNRDAAVAYLEELAAQPAFSHVHMLHIQPSNYADLTTLAFTIKASIR